MSLPRLLPIDANDPQFRDALVAEDLPIDDLLEPGRAFFCVQDAGGCRLAYGGFEQYGTDVLLRSMVVPAPNSGQGLGRGLLTELLRKATEAGARDAWLLTTTAKEFFRNMGFEAVDRDQAPAAILSTRQATSICPANAALLHRHLAD